MVPAGPENAKGIISVNYGKDPLDPQWANDPGMKNYKAFMAKYAPTWTPTTRCRATAGTAQLMAYILKQCGDDLTRARQRDEAGDQHQELYRRPVAAGHVGLDLTPDDYRINKSNSS